MVLPRRNDASECTYVANKVKKQGLHLMQINLIAYMFLHH